MKSGNSNTPLCLIILTIFAVFFFGEMIFLDKIPFYRDTILQFYPWQDFQTTVLKSGHLPLWNNLSGCGTPFIANLQSAVFYPFKILFILFPMVLAVKLFLLANFLVAAFSMFFLAKDFKLGDRAALLASLLFTFSGYMVTRAEFWSVLSASVWLPLILLFFKRFLEWGTILYFALSSLALALPIFAGSVQLFFYFCLFLLPFAIWYPPKERRSLWQRAGKLGLVTLTALLVSALQLFPFIEFVQNSVRQSGLTYSEVSNWSLRPVQLLNFLTPFFWGDPAVSAYYGNDQFWTSSIYCGATALLFLGLPVYFLSSRQKYFKPGEKSIFMLFGAIFALFLLLALGKYGGLHKVLFLLLPPFKMLRYPSVVIVISLFALSLIAGFTFERLFSVVTKRGGLKPIFVLGSLLLALLGVAFVKLRFLSPAVDPGRLRIAENSMLLSAAVLLSVMVLAYFVARRKIEEGVFTLLLLLLVAFDLILNVPGMLPLLKPEQVFSLPETAYYLQSEADDFRVLPAKNTLKAFNRYFEGSFHEKGYPYGDYISALKPIMHDNYNMLAGLKCSNVYDPMRLGRQEQFFKYFDGQENRQAMRIADLTNTKYFLSVYEMPELKFKVRLNGVSIYENTSVLPRAYVVYSLQNASSVKESFDLTVAPVFKPELTAIVEGAPWILKEKTGLALTKAFPTYLSDERVHIKFDAVAPGFLVLADSYYPGWEAVLDGAPAQIYKTNYMFRGVYVPQGPHTVEFFYRPVVFRAGLAVTLLALIFLIIGILWRSEKKIFQS